MKDAKMERLKEERAMTVIFIIIIASIASPIVWLGVKNDNMNSSASMGRFGSYREYKEFLDNNHNLTYGEYGISSYMSAGASSGGSQENDYSETNVQVAGVDEGDILKNNADYAYIISDNRSSIYILDIYPPETTSRVGIIENNWTAIELYLVEGYLIVLWAPHQQYFYSYGEYNYYYNGAGGTNVSFYSLADPKEPLLKKVINLPGKLDSSRIVGDYLYFIGTQSTSSVDNEEDLPVHAHDIQYIDVYDSDYVLTSIASVAINDMNAPPTIKSFLLGRSSNIYVSMENIYIAHAKQVCPLEWAEITIKEVYVNTMPPNLQALAWAEFNNVSATRWQRVNNAQMIFYKYIENLNDTERHNLYDTYEEGYSNLNKIYIERYTGTFLYRISIQKGAIDFAASGEVQGNVLNRFSMDEYDGHFRIATTKGRAMSGTPPTNMVFVLNTDLPNFTPVVMTTPQTHP